MYSGNNCQNLVFIYKDPHSVPINYKIEDLGCWKDSDADRALTTIEYQHPALKDPYVSRDDPYEKCLIATLDFGKT